MRLLVMASRDLRNPNFAGGDITLSEVAKRLAQRGHHVTYLCTRFRGSTDSENVNGVRIRRLGNIWTAAIIGFIYYMMNRSRFDAVLQESLGGLRIPYFASFYVRKPLVAVWYQRNDRIFRLQFGPMLAFGLNFMEHLLAAAHRRNLILCPSVRTIHDLQELGLDPAKMRLYTPGLADALLEERFDAQSNHREDMILWIGKMRKYKCPHHAILTLDRLRKAVPGTKLFMVGFPEDPKYLDYMKDMTSRLGLNESVEFKFKISETEKSQLLQRTKALLVTSPIEGFANVVSEANAFGAPVVVTDGVPADVVQNGANGVRVSFGDFDAMADGCRILLTDKALFNKMSEFGLSRTRMRTWERTADTFNGVLQEVTARS